jgi:hypothetical protein
MKPAVNGMDMPGWRIEQSEIRDLDVIRVHNLNQVWSGVFQKTLVELVPPGSTLPINGAIVT